MSEIDYVIREIKIKKEAVYDIIELYRLMKSFFDRYGYLLMEREYEDELKGDLSKQKLKFDALRRVDDYTKFVIRIKFKIGSYKKIKVNDKELARGDIEINFQCYLEKDYEGRWEETPIRKFFRGIYDKYIIGERFVRYENELREETYNLINEVKAFLNLHKF